MQLTIDREKITQLRHQFDSEMTATMEKLNPSKDGSHGARKPVLEIDIEHRLTRPKHPWTNGQVECMNRTIKDATVKRYHYGSHDQLKQHLQTFLMAYNFAKRLKTLDGLTLYEYICSIWRKDPKRFTLNPLYFTVGLNT